MRDDDPVYWFSAKRYGYGWSLPATWEGWVAIGTAFVLMAVGIKLFSQTAVGWCILYEAAIAAALFAVCYVKGEPLRWRWGKRTGA